ncbi:hypothetical protein Tco_1157610 [Tanacetum coccineum]
MSSLLLSTRGCSKILLISEESLYGLNKLFPNPFSIVDVGAMSDTPKNLKHRVSWPPTVLPVRHIHISESVGVSQSVELFYDSITGRWSHKRIVIIGWSDIKCISENVFVKVEPLLIQLTAVQSRDESWHMVSKNCWM